MPALHHLVCRVVLVLALVGCGGSDAPADDADVAGDTGGAGAYVPEALPDLATLPLPRGESGRPVVFALNGIQLELDDTARTPVTALVACTGWVGGCLQPGERNVDDCFATVPKCATEEPWNQEGICCAQACHDAYTALRAAGASEYDSFKQVMFRDRDCMPGVLGQLGGTP